MWKLLTSLAGYTAHSPYPHTYIPQPSMTLHVSVTQWHPSAYTSVNGRDICIGGVQAVPEPSNRACKLPELRLQDLD